MRRLLTLPAAVILTAALGAGMASADPGGPNLQPPIALHCTGGLTVAVNLGTATNRGRLVWAIDSTSVMVTAYLAFTNGTDTFVLYDSKPGLKDLITCTGDVGGGFTVITTGVFTPRHG